MPWKEERRAAPGEGFALLGACIGAHFGGDSTGIRQSLYSDPSVWGRLLENAVASGLAPAFEAAVMVAGLLPAASLRSGRGDLVAALAVIRSEHEARRAKLRANLIEIVEHMSRGGIEVTLIKGAASLWTGQPAWRSMRDLDILVSPREAAAALEQLRLLDYRWAPDGSASWHHLPVLIRDDLPGWIELHTAACNPRGEALLPSAELLRDPRSVPLPGDRIAVTLLHPARHVLHGLVHHHFSNRGAAYGLIAPKGLIEFAHGYSSLGSEDLQILRQVAMRSARLTAAVDLWVAAASDLLALRDNARFRSTADAAERWAAIRRRMEQNAPCSLLSALLEDARMSLKRSRLVGSVAAGSHRGPVAAAIACLSTFLRESPSTPGRRAAARQRATGLTPIVG